jgi:acetyl-CoA synthetase
VDLSRLLDPKSIAIVGASERAASYGGEALLNLKRIDYGGKVYAVNPGRDEVHGFDCFASLADLPEAPDAVIVAIPAEHVAAVIEQAGALGCGGAVVFAAGFSESREGEQHEAALVAAAAAHDLPVCGPNGNGIVSIASNFALWGDMVGPRDAGPVALVSQSGNVAVNAIASRRGLRLHTVVSCGNQAVLDAADYLEAFCRLDGVQSVACYLEAEGDGARWCAALEACARADVAVTILKAGSSEAGAAAAQAHTGAVAGDQRVFQAMTEAAGAAWARDPHELLETAKALAVRGRGGLAAGVAVMTCSGGDSSVCADLAAEIGVSLPALQPETIARLEELLPSAATAANPLDYTSLLWGDPGAIEGLVRALADDPGIGRVLVLYDQPDGLDGDAVESWAQAIEGVRAATDCPALLIVCSTLPELMPDDVAASLIDDGIAALAGLRSGLQAIAELVKEPATPERIAAIGEACKEAALGAGGELEWLSEHDAKSLLSSRGLAVPDGRVAGDEDDAVAALSQLGGRVAIKLSGRELRHKSELGALALDLQNEADVRAAYARLSVLPAASSASVFVEAMAEPGVEMIVAARTDAVVPALIVGLGGIWTELLSDAAVIPLPASAAEVEAAIRGLRGAALLDGGRGSVKLAIGALAQFAAGVGELLLEDRLELIECNPVIVSEHGAVAADALIARRCAQ